MNRAAEGIAEIGGELDSKPVASKSKQTTLFDRFGGEDWKERSKVTLWYDSSDRLLEAEFESLVSEDETNADSLKTLFEKKCEENKSYQLRFDEFDLMTS